MSDVFDKARIAVTSLHGADAGPLVQALRDARADVLVCPTADVLAERTAAGDFHAAVLATDRPDELPRQTVRTLLATQADTSMLFLVPRRGDWWKCEALRGATQDQVHDLAMSPAELVDLLRAEIASVRVSQPDYLVVCVDDDSDFLASLEGLLPPHLERACPRFALRFAFCNSPAEAMALMQSPHAGELALIISDQGMPGMKGVDLLARAKALCPKARRVLLTGYAGMDTAIAAINERVLDMYLTKPVVQPADFVNSLQHLLGEYHLGRTRDIDRQRLLGQFELIRVLSRAPNLRSTMEAVSVCLDENLLASRRWAVLLRDGDDLLVQETSRLPEGLSPGQSLSADEGLAGWVMRNNRPIFASTDKDLPACPPARLGLAPGPVGSLRGQLAVEPPFMAVPMAGSGSPTGLVLVSCCPSGLPGMAPLPPGSASPISRSERVMLSFVADAAGIAVGGLADRQALQDHYVATMASLAEAVEAKDVYTRGHTDRVCELTLALADACGVSEPDRKDIERAALLHDIGKIAVPDAIVDKPGPLTSGELAIIRQHPARGEKILKHLRFLNHARLILRSHHERYDGQGYPDRLTGEEIPLGARMLAIADSYDAMTSTRPYRQAMSPRVALDEIGRNAGRQFDPMLVATFLDLLARKTGRTLQSPNHGPAVARSALTRTPTVPGPGHPDNSQEMVR